MNRGGMQPRRLSGTKTLPWTILNGHLFPAVGDAIDGQDGGYTQGKANRLHDGYVNPD